ncbi:HNH endonuclease [Synechococcus sp. PCC 6312]|uniref:HNH endonuclease n=1 Tax=Synechococcus sp. (strain ATCC 27167 / PCC 6312) TaxID=195253 RepID=UPI00029F2EAE|nr:HNH endonuclease signature motif containing protein [Synechococcus sp. PCC 6312]AFY61322.1 restriction endonuclease [Synechococcus sp. PCC 6312]
MHRKAVPEKIRKRIFQEASMVCPVCGETDVTTLEMHHIDPYSEVVNHKEENIILLCSNCHSKVTAGKISKEEILKLKISLMHGNNPNLNRAKDTNVINFNQSVNNGVIANNLHIKNEGGKIKVNPPNGTIASSMHHKNYVKRLIDRYHEFKLADVGAKNMNYTLLYSTIKREFGAKWDMIPLDQFERLVSYIQRRIDNTILGKNQKSNDVKRYSTFDEFLSKYSS